jgi:hypothetical protein
MDDLSLYDDLMRQTMVACWYRGTVKDRIRGVFLGLHNGLYLHGRPGTSKINIVRTTLETLGANYAYSNGHLTPIGYFDLLDENRDRVIVLWRFSRV